MRQALPEAMRARDKVAVSALRATLAALDNAEAVPVGDAELRGVAIEASPVGVGAAEAIRRELSEDDMAEIVRAEAAERLELADRLTAPAHADQAARLRAEAAVLLGFLDGPAAPPPRSRATAKPDEPGRHARRGAGGALGLGDRET